MEYEDLDQLSDYLIHPLTFYFLGMLFGVVLTLLGLLILG